MANNRLLFNLKGTMVKGKTFLMSNPSAIYRQRANEQGECIMISRAMLFMTMVLTLAQPACIVAGYRSGGGWFFWPGGILGLLLIIAVIFLVMRH
jgi:hypothetical protein